MNAYELDPNGKNPNEPGAKLDAGKPRAWLCVAGFSRALAEVAKVTTFGANKYTPNGWQSVPGGQARYMDAFARHMLKLGAGQTIDPETGCPEKAHMIWNLLASLELDLRAGEADEYADAVPASVEAARVEFEAWMRDNYADHSLELAGWGGGYKWHDTHEFWRAWLAGEGLE